MTPEINEFIKKVSTAKGITVLLILFFLAIFVWKNLDFLAEVSFTFKKEKTTKIDPKRNDKTKHGVSQLELGKIIIPPCPAKLPSILVFEIKNPGSAITKDVHINLDLGVAKVIAYEVIGPKGEDTKGSGSNKSILNIDVKQIRPHESIYLYLQTSIPTFKKISLSSDSTIRVEDFTLTDFLSSEESRTNPTFNGFLLFLLGGFILVMSFYFTGILISKLNKYFKMKW